MEELQVIAPFIAKKDHTIVQNETTIILKKGERYTKIPKKWEVTLKTEKVI